MKKLVTCVTFISFAILFIFSCQKDKTSDLPVDNNGSNNSLRTTVSGMVLDESNTPLNGVTVAAYGQTTSTDQHGVFVLKNINANKDRCVLQFSKSGYFKRAHGFIASANTVNYVRIILLNNAATQNFSSSAGGTISLPDGSSATFQPNSFVTTNGSAYTGTVNLSVKHLSPDDANFGFMIPGSDLLGKDLNNKDVALYTYGMLGVELTGSSGEALQLANGTSATLTLAIAASQFTSAPATIPLWFFDETTSLWKEEGTANKVGNNYVGIVAHFSWWNCDDPYIFSKIKGKVVDCYGTGVPNVTVSLNGVAGAWTNQNGEYNEVFISGATYTMELQVLSSNNYGQVLNNSQIEIIPTLSVNQVYTVPNFIVTCPPPPIPPTKLIVQLKQCIGNELSPGFIYAAATDFLVYKYLVNGNCTIEVPPNVSLQVYAFENNVSFEQIITTPSAGNNIILDNVHLCDVTTASLNSFVLNGGSFSNQIFNIDITNSSAQLTDTFGFAQTSIYITGSDLPYTISNYNITVDDTIPGASTCGIYIIMTDPTNYYNITGSSVSCNLTEVGTVGNKIKGNYYGVVVTSINGNSSSGNISGSFDVIRTQ